MTWCRRDPSLWRVHHLSRHRLPHHRTFSSSLTRSARYDDADTKRPDGVSDREWVQLQQYRAQVVQYRRWRRKLHEDPYRALFGASENMLMGRGLKDWVPKWMLEAEEEGVERKVDAGELALVIAMCAGANMMKGGKIVGKTARVTGQQRRRGMRSHATRRRQTPRTGAQVKQETASQHSANRRINPRYSSGRTLGSSPRLISGDPKRGHT
jgi:hypothetical protein